jgi:hypothetical protein
MRKMLLGAVASAALLAAGAASAAINVSFWVNRPAVAVDARFTNLPGLGAPNGTAVVNAINFSTGNSAATTFDQWLGVASSGGNGAAILDNGVFLFTGSTFLNAGNNAFVVPHDDGLQLNIDGIGLVLNQPGPTSPVNTPFNVNAPSAGMYNFQLVYGECCAGPAVLAFQVNGQPGGGVVPEPATWAMMLLGFGGLGAMLRRNRRLAFA